MKLSQAHCKLEILSATAEGADKLNFKGTAFAWDVLEPTEHGGKIEKSNLTFQDGEQYPLNYEHMSSDIGNFTVLEASDVGLEIQGTITKLTRMGKIVAEAVENGTISGLSIEVYPMESPAGATAYELCGAAITGIPANPQSAIMQIFSIPPVVDFPVDEEAKWDKGEALKRWKEFTKSDKKPSKKFKDGYLWYDGAKSNFFGAYHFPIVDVVDGKPKIILAALHNAKARLANADSVPDEDKPKVAARIEKYLERVSKKEENSKLEEVTKMNVPAPTTEAAENKEMIALSERVANFEKTQETTRAKLSKDIEIINLAVTELGKMGKPANPDGKDCLRAILKFAANAHRGARGEDLFAGIPQRYRHSELVKLASPMGWQDAVTGGELFIPAPELVAILGQHASQSAAIENDALKNVGKTEARFIRQISMPTSYWSDTGTGSASNPASYEQTIVAMHRIAASVPLQEALVLLGEGVDGMTPLDALESAMRQSIMMTRQTAFAVGVGIGQPTGLATSGRTRTLTSSVANGFVSDDWLDLIANEPRNYGQCSLYTNRFSALQLQKLKNLQDTYLFMLGYQNDQRYLTVDLSSKPDNDYNLGRVTNVPLKEVPDFPAPDANGEYITGQVIAAYGNLQYSYGIGQYPGYIFSVERESLAPQGVFTLLMRTFTGGNVIDGNGITLLISA